jgi:hypothetical protein
MRPELAAALGNPSGAPAVRPGLGRQVNPLEFLVAGEGGSGLAAPRTPGIRRSSVDNPFLTSSGLCFKGSTLCFKGRDFADQGQRLPRLGRAFRPGVPGDSRSGPVGEPAPAAGIRQLAAVSKHAPGLTVGRNAAGGHTAAQIAVRLRVWPLQVAFADHRRKEHAGHGVERQPEMSRGACSLLEAVTFARSRPSGRRRCRRVKVCLPARVPIVRQLRRSWPTPSCAGADGQR